MWWPSLFDATLGFPGEGPSPPRIAMSPIGRPADGEWLAKASRVLQGAEAFTGQGWIADGLSADAIHDSLSLRLPNGAIRRVP